MTESAAEGPAPAPLAAPPDDAERLGLLEEVFRRAPTFLHVLRGPDFVFELANPAYYQLVGHRDLIGRPAFEALPEAAAGGYPERLARVMATGEPFVGRELPVTLARTPGAPPEERLIDLVYLPIVAPDGACRRVLGHGTDVTEQVHARRAAEAALRASEARARFLAELGAALQPLPAPDAAMATAARMLGEHVGADRCAYAEVDADADHFTIAGDYVRGDMPRIAGRFAMSAFGAEALRLSREGHPWVVADADADPRLSPADRAAYAATRIRAVISVPLHKAGRFVAGMAVHQRTPRRWTPAEVDLVTTVVQRCWESIERARALRALREREAALLETSARLAESTEAAQVAQRQAEAASEAKSRFLATMSHELRTPLNAIGGYAELIELGLRGPVTPEQLADLARIQRSKRHLLGLINEVLNYAKVEAGVVEFLRRPVRVADAVADAEALVAPQLRAKGLGYAWAGCDPGLAVWADPDKLQQILLNLLSNAVKFTNARPGLPGRIEASCDTAADARVRIHVRDTGVGIPPDKIDAVFEPFVQVGRASNRPMEGTGLGLAISRELARGMGGDLTAESTPGVGSTFTLTLPAGAVPAG